MSHFGRSGPPDITDTYSLLVLNITFRTTADDLFPLFDKYGKVVDIFIPRDRRTGDSRGFAFVRYKYSDEAQKAVERLDGRVVDGREITVQFAKYGPNAERIHRGKISETFSKSGYRSRSRSPRRRDYRRRSRSRSWDRYDRDRHRARYRDYHRRSRSRSASPYYSRGRGRSRYDDEQQSSSRSRDSLSPRRSPGPRRSYSPRKNSPVKVVSPDRRSRDSRSPTPRSASPRGRVASRSPSQQYSDDMDDRGCDFSKFLMSGKIKRPPLIFKTNRVILVSDIRWTQDERVLPVADAANEVDLLIDLTLIHIDFAIEVAYNGLLLPSMMRSVRFGKGASNFDTGGGCCLAVLLACCQFHKLYASAYSAVRTVPSHLFVRLVSVGYKPEYILLSHALQRRSIGFIIPPWTFDIHRVSVDPMQ
ncbi:unnamed protein product [Dovyalis caffra]|uniref:RRM domain-containing protein n=1 Tax=Dovyalis caffra TaxID=77055 RepID=A0AAV1SWS0_9ROSI|nr:unnamed protein product [Dovyalis caffra]